KEGAALASLSTADLAAAATLMNGSAEWNAFADKLKSSGTLRLGITLDLSNLLHPAVQPGAVLDHEWPDEKVNFRFTSSLPFGMLGAQGTKEAAIRTANGKFELAKEVTCGNGTRVGYIIEAETSSVQPDFTVTYSTAADPRPRPLSPQRFIAPWLDRDSSSAKPTQPLIPLELAGGDWMKGREVFYAEQSQ